MHEVVPVRTNDEGLANVLLTMGRQVPQGQWVRELVVNTAENGGDEVIFDAWTDDVNARTYTRASDNGDGMTPRQLSDHIGTIFNSAHGIDDNFGMGSRVALLASNPTGITFASRAVRGQQETEAMMTICVQNGKIGSRVYDLDRGQRSEIVAPFPGMLDRLDKTLKASHGTAVIQMGNNAAATWKKGTDYSILQALTDRFWEYPQTSTGNALRVRVMEHSQQRLKKVPSYSERLLETALASDVMEFTTERYTGRIWWAIVPPASQQTKTTSGGQVLRTGVAALCSGEMFGLSQASLGDFGISWGDLKRQIVIMVEVDGAEMTPQRDSLSFFHQDANGDLRNRITPPWEEIGQWFIANTPEPIQALLDERRSAHRRTGKISDLIPEDLKKFLRKVVVHRKGSDNDTGFGDEGGGNVPGGEVLDIEGGNDQPGNTRHRKHRKPVERSKEGPNPSKTKEEESYPDVHIVTNAELDDDNVIWGCQFNAATQELLISREHQSMMRLVRNFQETTNEPEDLIQAAVENSIRMHLCAATLDAYSTAEWGLTDSQIDQLHHPSAIMRSLLGVLALHRTVEVEIRRLKRDGL